MNITENELIEALRQAIVATPSDDGALTLRELVGVWHCGEDTARKHVRNLVGCGRMEVLRSPRERIDKIVCPTTVYRLKP